MAYTCNADRSGAIARLRGLDGRLIVIAAVVLYFIGVWISRSVFTTDLWLLGGVPVMRPTFGDMRSVTEIWDCIDRGVPVYVAGPCLPQAFNYPRAITWGQSLGLGPSDAVWLSVFVDGLFLVVALTLLGRLRLLEGVVAAAVFCSPPVMLGLERANPDLLVFGLLGLAALAASRLWLLRAVLLFVAAMLKFYPAVAMIMLLRDRWPRAAWAFGGTLAAFLAYFGATASDLDHLDSSVIRAVQPAYGYLTLQDGLTQGFGLFGPLPWVGDIPHWLILAVAAMLLGGAAVVVARWCGRPAQVSPRAATDGFWAGGAVFIVCWFLGSNFDYRLASLVLVLPLLFAWSRSGGRLAVAARITCGLIVLALYTSTTYYLGQYPTYLFPLDELLLLPVMGFVAGGLLLTAPAELRLPRWAAGVPTGTPTAATG